jgi:hypothetical protein
VYAIQYGRNLQGLLVEAINDWFAKERAHRFEAEIDLRPAGKTGRRQKCLLKREREVEEMKSDHEGGAPNLDRAPRRFWTIEEKTSGPLAVSVYDTHSGRTRGGWHNRALL